MSRRRCRLPWPPLERYAMLNTEALWFPGPSGFRESSWRTDAAVNISAFAELIEVNHHTVHKWRRAGVPFFEADRAAIRLGTHPALIWPEWLHQEPPPVEHGTTSGVAWHRTYDVPTCEPCLEVERERQRAQRAERRARARAAL